MRFFFPDHGLEYIFTREEIFNVSPFSVRVVFNYRIWFDSLCDDVCSCRVRHVIVRFSTVNFSLSPVSPPVIYTALSSWGQLIQRGKGLLLQQPTLSKSHHPCCCIEPANCSTGKVKQCGEKHTKSYFSTVWSQTSCSILNCQDT